MSLPRPTPASIASASSRAQRSASSTAARPTAGRSSCRSSTRLNDARDAEEARAAAEECRPPPPRSPRSGPPAPCRRRPPPPARAAGPGSAPGPAASKSSRATAARSSDCTPEAMRSGQPSACAIGVRMSGLPSWARIEPSTYSTSECTMLCGCTTTSTRSGSIPNSRQASISSSPLFISVAESTEILRPMRQRGCAQASLGRDAGHALERRAQERAARGREQDARARPRAGRPVSSPAGRHWKIALCSLSIGMSVAPPARADSIRSGPASTSDSLFASSTRLPARAAASVERQAGGADDGRHDGVDVGHRRHTSRALRPRSAPRLASRRRAARRRGGSAASGDCSTATRGPVPQALLEQASRRSWRPRAPRPRSARGGARARRAC